jgi:hypothetical protein
MTARTRAELKEKAMSRDPDHPRPQSYGLGVGRGSMVDNYDGTVSYRPTGKFMDVFRVRVTEITGLLAELSGFLSSAPAR